MAGQRAYRDKVHDIRPVQRRNIGGGVSTVILQQMDNYAYPTLFPIDPDNPTSDPSGWFELQGEEAFNEARNRDELFVFDTDEEAKSFAEGSWKHLEEKPTSKSIDDIMQQSNLMEVLAPRDVTNVEVKGPAPQMPDSRYGIQPDPIQELLDMADPIGRGSLEDLLMKMKQGKSGIKTS